MRKVPLDSCAVLSEETLIGDPATGKYYGEEVGKRIYDSYPEAKILITIREQKSLILSAYREYIHGGGIYSLERFIGADVKKDGFSPIFQFEFLMYDRVVSFYKALFGDKNVEILILESLSNNRSEYLRRLYEFSEIEDCLDDNEYDFTPVHSGRTGVALLFLRFANRYVPRPDYKMNRYPISWKIVSKLAGLLQKISSGRLNRAIDNRMKNIINKASGSIFKSSNNRLSDLLEQPLPSSYDR